MKGLTLVETILVIAIVVILFSLAGIYLPQFLNTNYLETAADDVIWSLRQMREKSNMAELDSQWGIFFNQTENKFILFKGQTFLDRDLVFDEEKKLPSAVRIQELRLEGPGNEIVFIKSTGETLSPGYLILATPGQKTKKIIINKIGLIDTE